MKKDLRIPVRIRKAMKSLLKRKKFLAVFFILAALAVAIPCFWAGAKFGVYINELERLVRDRFREKSRELPARIYARPLVIHPGLLLDPELFAAELKLLKYRQTKTVDSPGSFARTGNTFDLFTRRFRFMNGWEPPGKIRVALKKNEVVSVSDIDTGKRLERFRLEPAHLGGVDSGEHEDRILVKISDVPPLLVRTLLAVEDREFYEHGGVDVSAVLRAAVANIQKWRPAQGASTLTQQLARSFFLTREQTLERKIDEAAIAVILEKNYSKNEILEAYLNEVYLGQDGNRAVCGFGMAASHYFGRGVKDLRPHEIAMLVGLLKGPSQYNPKRFPEKARSRRDTVLKIMKDQNLVSHETFQSERERKIEVMPDSFRKTFRFPAYLDLVKRRLRSGYDKKYLRKEGLRIFTAFDPQVQLKVEKAVAAGLKAVEKRHKIEKESLEAGVVVTSVPEREVLAVTGGRDFRFHGFNRALDAERPIGSLAKPAVFLSALRYPEYYNLVTPLDDSEIKVTDEKGNVWSPKNFDLAYHGRVPLFRALVHSYNAATVRLGLEIGLDSLPETMKKLGIDREIPVYPSSMLGSMAMSPLEVARMYQAIASNGDNSPLRVVRGVCANGKILPRYRREARENIESASVYLLNVMLNKVIAEGTAAPVRKILPRNLHAAGKTGTTNDLRDSWFAGYTGDRLATVWIGRDDYKSSGLTGAKGALVVWGRIMAQISRVPLKFSRTNSVKWANVDPETGEKVGKSCARSVYIPFVSGFEPSQTGDCADEDTAESSGSFFKQWLENVFD